MHKITLIPGDGTGPEIAIAMKRCVEATGVKIEWDIQEAGDDVFKKEGTPLPQRVIDSIKENKVAIKAPITTPVASGYRSVNVALRKELDLYQNIRPVKYYNGVQSKYENIDIVIFKTKRIVEAAFKYAIKHGRKKITVVHKANIMKHTDGLFLNTAREVANSYPGIEFEDRIVDNMAMQLVQKPEQYDVLVLPNLYGDIISDLCAGLIGGLGVAPGANIGNEYAIFEAVHGSAPKYKGLNKVNPTALILSAVLMLRHINEEKASNILEEAVADVIKEGKYVTYDLKKGRNDSTAVGTSEMADAIIGRIETILKENS